VYDNIKEVHLSQWSISKIEQSKLKKERRSFNIHISNSSDKSNYYELKLVSDYPALNQKFNGEFYVVGKNKENIKLNSLSVKEHPYIKSGSKSISESKVENQEDQNASISQSNTSSKTKTFTSHIKTNVYNYNVDYLKTETIYDASAIKSLIKSNNAKYSFRVYSSDHDFWDIDLTSYQILQLFQFLNFKN
jgi:type 1 fimbria pilin